MTDYRSTPSTRTNKSNYDANSTDQKAEILRAIDRSIRRAKGIDSSVNLLEQYVSARIVDLPK